MEALEVKKFDCKTLATILFGAFETPQNVVRTVRHNFGLAGSPRYVPPARPRRSELSPIDRLTDSGKKILTILRQQQRPISAADMEKKTPWTRNHCNMIMGSLFRDGLLTRKKVRENGTYCFYYSVKK